MTRRNNTGRKSFFTPAMPVPVPQAYPYPEPVPPAPQQPRQQVPAALTVQVQVQAAADATTAKAVLSDAAHPWNEILSLTRSSKREPGDAYDEEIGTLYAASRALRAVALKMQKHADALVRHAESNKRQHARATAGAVWGEGGQDGDAGFTLHLSPGTTEADIPGPVRELISNLFPGADVTFVTDETDDVPAEVAKVVESFLGKPENGTRRKRPARHARANGDGDDQPIDPDLLKQG